MQMAQKQEFHDRIKRVERGGPNTFGTVYCGVQDVDTPKNKKVKGVTVAAVEVDPDSAPRLMRGGLLKGLMQVAACGLCIVLYVAYVGV
ncbi:hypothetical protein [Celeribacter sp.]|uniref:hypothetical protein n=1 Tax=Celeribacter sp. TaxID=1890673 RepID=UPI003A8EBDA7